MPGADDRVAFPAGQTQGPSRETSARLDELAKELVEREGHRLFPEKLLKDATMGPASAGLFADQIRAEREYAMREGLPPSPSHEILPKPDVSRFFRALHELRKPCGAPIPATSRELAGFVVMYPNPPDMLGTDNYMYVSTKTGTVHTDVNRLWEATIFENEAAAKSFLDECPKSGNRVGEVRPVHRETSLVLGTRPVKKEKVCGV